MQTLIIDSTAKPGQVFYPQFQMTPDQHEQPTNHRAQEVVQLKASGQTSRPPRTATIATDPGRPVLLPVWHLAAGLAYTNDLTKGLCGPCWSEMCGKSVAIKDRWSGSRADRRPEKVREKTRRETEMEGEKGKATKRVSNGDREAMLENVTREPGGGQVWFAHSE